VKAGIILVIGLLALSCSDTDDTASVVQTLDPPTSLTLTRIGKTAVKLSWQDNSNSEESFSVERKANQGVFTPRLFTTRNVTTVVDSSGLSTDTTYSYRVRALRYTESSGYSNIVTIQLTLPFP
jgi:hypothetical protein